MRIYGLEHAPRLSDFRNPARIPADDSEIVFVGSGKAAISLILLYLKTTGVLKSKMTPILVPEWLGTWVYAQILPYAFPTIVGDAGVAAAVCYHQYGFPQNMDKVLDIAESRRVVIIEDCAHAVGSLYKGKPLGAMGEFALFSFSKFAFCYALGGVKAKDERFYSFVARQKRKSSVIHRTFVNGVKYFSEWADERAHPQAAKIASNLTSMAYALYGSQFLASPRAMALWLSKRDEELAARRKNFQMLRAEADKFGLCDHLETEGVTPYAVPLYVKESRIASLVSVLRKNGIASGAYHFDFARCVFEPDFRQCVLVPIHSGMGGYGMERLIEAIKEFEVLNG